MSEITASSDAGLCDALRRLGVSENSGSPSPKLTNSFQQKVVFPDISSSSSEPLHSSVDNSLPSFSFSYSMSPGSFMQSDRGFSPSISEKSSQSQFRSSFSPVQHFSTSFQNVSFQTSSPVHHPPSFETTSFAGVSNLNSSFTFSSVTPSTPKFAPKMSSSFSVPQSSEKLFQTSFSPSSYSSTFSPASPSSSSVSFVPLKQNDKNQMKSEKKSSFSLKGSLPHAIPPPPIPSTPSVSTPLPPSFATTFSPASHPISAMISTPSNPSFSPDLPSASPSSGGLAKKVVKASRARQSLRGSRTSSEPNEAVEAPHFQVGFSPVGFSSPGLSIATEIAALHSAISAEWGPRSPAIQRLSLFQNSWRNFFGITGRPGNFLQLTTQDRLDLLFGLNGVGQSALTRSGLQLLDRLGRLLNDSGNRLKEAVPLLHLLRTVVLRNSAFSAAAVAAAQAALDSASRLSPSCDPVTHPLIGSQPDNNSTALVVDLQSLAELRGWLVHFELLLERGDILFGLNELLGSAPVSVAQLFPPNVLKLVENLKDLQQEILEAYRGGTDCSSLIMRAHARLSSLLRDPQLLDPPLAAGLALHLQFSENSSFSSTEHAALNPVAHVLRLLSELSIPPILNKVQERIPVLLGPHSCISLDILSALNELAIPSNPLIDSVLPSLLSGLPFVWNPDVVPSLLESRRPRFQLRPCDWPLRAVLEVISTSANGVRNGEADPNFASMENIPSFSNAAEPVSLSRTQALAVFVWLLTLGCATVSSFERDQRLLRDHFGFRSTLAASSATSPLQHSTLGRLFGLFSRSPGRLGLSVRALWWFLLALEDGLQYAQRLQDLGGAVNLENAALLLTALLRRVAAVESLRFSSQLSAFLARTDICAEDFSFRSAVQSQLPAVPIVFEKSPHFVSSALDNVLDGSFDETEDRWATPSLEALLRHTTVCINVQKAHFSGYLSSYEEEAVFSKDPVFALFDEKGRPRGTAADDELLQYLLTSESDRSTFEKRIKILAKCDTIFSNSPDIGEPLLSPEQSRFPLPFALGTFFSKICIKLTALDQKMSHFRLARTTAMRGLTLTVNHPELLFKLASILAAEEDLIVALKLCNYSIAVVRVENGADNIFVSAKSTVEDLRFLRASLEAKIRKQREKERLQREKEERERRKEQEEREREYRRQTERERESWYGSSRSNYRQRKNFYSGFSEHIPDEIDHYKVLKVSRSASIAEIKASYRKLVLTSHPDKGGSVEAFRIIQESYEALLKRFSS